MSETRSPGRYRVLAVHNAYQHRGGEDTVVTAEISLLQAHGHEVASYCRTNHEVTGRSSLRLACDTLWSTRTSRDITEILHRFQPAVIHVHNTFPLISPSLYWAAARAGIPVVQTLHNFRLLCLSALLMREGRPCEDCMGCAPWRGIGRACYRGSHTASAVLAGMLTLHRALGTYQDKVTRYVALTEYSRSKFIEGGLPPRKLLVKPNFVDFPVPELIPRRGLLYVGRLSAEKGVAVLAKAVTLTPDVSLRVAGEGPDGTALEGLTAVTRLGVLSSAEVRAEMNLALAVVVPSICYENFPLAIVEAMACGTPVIASRIGALAEIVCDGETGLLFEPGNPYDLASRIAWAYAHPQRMIEMGRKARTRYEARFTAEANYRRLIDIYDEAIAETRGSK